MILPGIVDTPMGRGEPDDHIVVFDPAQIKISAVRFETDSGCQIDLAFKEGFFPLP